MKRLLPLIVGLSLVSCDSGTKEAEGTSSETQTALQALADNVIEVPRGPGGARVPIASQTAARSAYTGRDACASGAAWSWVGFAQAEYYDGRPWWHQDSSFAWQSVRSELATDNHGNFVPGECPIGPLKARAVDRWRAQNGERASFEGVFWRDHDSGGMTFARWEGAIVYPSGFELRASILRSGPNLLLLPDTLLELSYSFAEGRYGFRFRYSPGLNGANWEGLDSAWNSIACVAILDRANSSRQVGSVCGSPGTSRWIIRDAKGNVLNPQRNPAIAIDDSMGVRVLSTRWDGDSLRVRFRVKTPPFSLRQTSRTRVVVGDTASLEIDCVTPEGMNARCPQPILFSDKEFAFTDTNFVGPEDGELAFFAQDLASRSMLRIELHREYRLPVYSQRHKVGTWWFQVPSREE